MDNILKENEALKGFVKTAEAKTQEMAGTLSAYEALGTPEELATIVAIVKESSKSIEDLTASKESLLTTNEELTSKLANYESLGSVEDINETSDKASELLSKYMDFGTIDQLEKVESFLMRLEATGYKIEDLEKMSDESKKAEEASILSSLTKDFSISEELAKKTIDFTGSYESAKEYLVGLFPNAIVADKKDETVGTPATIVADTTNENKETKKSVIADGSVSKLLK